VPSLEAQFAMLGPAHLETTVKDASMKQIHAAIDHHAKEQWECAITLAAAGEGIPPPTDEEHFRQKVKAHAATMPEVDAFSNDPNEVINWLKHGNFKGERRDNVAIDNGEPLVIIWRAITKFYAVYGEVSQQMVDWQEAVKKALIASGVKPKAHEQKV